MNNNNQIQTDLLVTDKDGNQFIVKPVYDTKKENAKMLSVYEQLIKNMKNTREQKGITQQEMADFTGLSKNYISAVERGINKCSAEVLLQYARTLKIPVSQLVGDDKNVIDPELRMMLGELSSQDLETVKALARHLYNKNNNN